MGLRRSVRKKGERLGGLGFIDRDKTNRDHDRKFEFEKFVSEAKICSASKHQKSSNKP